MYMQSIFILDMFNILPVKVNLHYYIWQKQVNDLLLDMWLTLKCSQNSESKTESNNIMTIKEERKGKLKQHYYYSFPLNKLLFPTH